MDEVLQIQSVFANVSKGQLAKKEDLMKAFGHDRQLEICKDILNKGELQVSDKERQSQLETQFTEIANIVVENSINPTNNRPYPISMIEKAMKTKIHYSVKPNQNSKQQAMQVIKLLKEQIPIERAKKKIRIVVSKNSADKVSKLLAKLFWVKLMLAF